MAEIVLSSDQAEDFQKTIEITDRHPMVLQTSPAGSGKTIHVIEFLRKRNIARAIIVCANSVQIDHWTLFKEKYNAPISMIITYDTLRGSKTYTTNDGREMLTHGLLYKNNDESYCPTEGFMQWVEEGLLLVPDECHSIKNDRGKTAAFRSLSRYITMRSMTKPYPLNKSWTFFLSMTPFDKPEHCCNFVFTCGIITSHKLYSKDHNLPTGIIELYNYCKHFNPTITDSIWGLYDIKSNNVQELAYRLVSEVFLRLISTFTKNSQDRYKMKQSIYYSYSDIPQEAHILMKRGLDMIRAPIKMNLNEEPKFPVMDSYITQLFSHISGGVDINTRSGVIQGTITCQTVKTFYIVIPLIHHIFQTVPNSKIIVFLDYKESVDIIMNNLSTYSPVKITGDSECTKERRKAIIDKFNEPNLELRLLAIISQIGSDSIELDDKHGNFPRIGLGLPDFYYSRFFQCPGRIFRRFTESNSLFFWCLSNTEEYSEESVFKSIKDKSEVMEQTLQNNEIIPPIYYEKITNPHLHDISFLIKNAGMNKINRHDKDNKSLNNIVRVSEVTFRKRF
uniref:Helicase ATP-binding domain-containing protein n=1 Tax=viral metagenome TaxID=1070528 RepID=A0A6C0BE95_9ZZZZ